MNKVFNSLSRSYETSMYARTTGNPFWLKTGDEWAEFLAYEHQVNRAVETQRVLSLCTYPVGICSAKNLLGTVSSHHGHASGSRR